MNLNHYLDEGGLKFSNLTVDTHVLLGWIPEVQIRCKMRSGKNSKFCFCFVK